MMYRFVRGAIRMACWFRGLHAGPAVRRAAVFTLLLGGGMTHAQLTYDANTGSDGAQDGAGAGWNTSNSSWWNGSANVMWPNTSSSTAIFGAGSGAADVVSVGAVTANRITFNAPGSGSYTLSGGTITLDGVSPAIVANVNANIGSTLTGSAGFTKTGAGTLTLTGNNSGLLGTIAVLQGRLVSRVGWGSATENALGGTQTTPTTVNIAPNATLSYSLVNTTASTPRIDNLLTGSGIVELVFTSGGTARNTNFNASFASSFTGEIRLLTSSAGSSSGDKWNTTGGVTTAASVVVSQGTQLFVSGGNVTTAGGVTVIGTGNSENRGAIRLGSTLNGQVTLAGNTLIGPEGGTITGNITNSAAAVLTIGGNSTAGLTLSGSIQDGVGRNSLTIAAVGNSGSSAQGVVNLTGTTGNNFTGVVTIQTGLLHLGKTAGVHAIYGDGVAGTADVIIGGTTSPVGVGTDTLRLGASNQIRDSVEIQMHDTIASVFTLVNGGTNSSEAIGSLSSANAAASVVLGSGTLTVRNGRSGVGAATTFAGVISGTGNLVMEGSEAGVFTVSGANSYSGSTTIKSGTLALDNSVTNGSKLSDTAALILGNGTLVFTGAAGDHVEQVLSTTVNASASIQRSGGNTARIALGALTVNAGAVLEIQSAGLATTTTGNNAGGILARVTLGGVLAMNDGSNNIVAYNAFTDVNRLGGSITSASGSHVRIIEGGSSGNVTLAASGTTDISTLSNAGSAGLTTVNIGTGNVLRLGAEGVITNADTSVGLTFAGGTLTAGGADNTAGELLFINSTATSTIVTSTIANNGSGAVSVTKAGSGVLDLTASSSYTGGTTVSGGTLKVSHTGALGAAGQAVVLRGGTLLLATDSAMTSKQVTMAGDAAIVLDRSTAGAGFNTTLGAFTSTAGDYTLSVSKGGNVTSGTASLTFSGTLSITGRNTTFDVGADVAVILSGNSAVGAQNISMVKNGAGTLVLSGTFGTWDSGAATRLNEGTLDLRVIMGDNNQYRADLVAQGGTTLRLTRDTALNYMSSLTVSGSMEVVVDRITSSAVDLTNTLNNLMIGGSTLIVSRGSGITGAAVAGLTFSGTTTLNGYTTFAVAASTRLTLGGAISGTYGIIKQGVGDMVLSGVNTYTGSTTVGGGTLQVEGSGQLGTGAYLANISIADTATFRYSSSAAQTISGTISGAGSLVKDTASSTLTLNSINTYSGSTVVSAGTLALTSVGTTGTGAVTVQSGGTLLGTGVVQGSSFTVASGGSVHAGSSTSNTDIGTLNFTPASGGGTFDFQAGSNTFLDIRTDGSNGADLLNFIGTGSNTLKFEGNLKIGPDSFTPGDYPVVFNLLDWTGLAESPVFASHFSMDLIRDGSLDNGSGFDLPDISAAAGYYWDLSLFTTQGIIILAPEPGRALLLLAGFLALGLRRRRIVRGVSAV